MTNLDKFHKWAINKGHGKVRIPLNLLDIFLDYLDDNYPIKNEEVLESSKSCETCANHNLIIMRGTCMVCIKVDRWKSKI